MILDDLKFVQGAVVEHGMAPEIAHFHIRNGGITAFNGVIALHSPLPLNEFELRPHANQLIQAIGACKHPAVTLKYNDSKLNIRSGTFTSNVDCLPLKDAPEPHKSTPGEQLPLGGGIRDVLKKLIPFIGQDATRPWCRGMMFDGSSVFATNNIILIEHHINVGTVPVRVNIPKQAITELIRIGMEPLSVSMDESTVTFYYEGGRWLSTLTYTTEWPDVTKLLEQRSEWGYTPTDDFWGIIEHLAPFADKRLRHIYIGRDRISTEETVEVGSSVETDIFSSWERGYKVKFNVDMLLKLKPLATTIDFKSYPEKPSVFYGDMLRGAIVGMR